MNIINSAKREFPQQMGTRLDWSLPLFRYLGKTLGNNRHGNCSIIINYLSQRLMVRKYKNKKDKITPIIN